MKYRGPRVKIARKLGPLLGLTNKLGKIKKKKQTITPGQRGKNHKFFLKNKTTYGLRLLEKQKLRYYYNITERQLIRYVKLAKKMKGATGTILMRLLNLRLDTIVFRLGIAPTIPAARQLINHGHIEVNKIKVDIPSYICKRKDVIKVRQKSLALALFKIKKLPRPKPRSRKRRFKSSPTDLNKLQGGFALIKNSFEVQQKQSQKQKEDAPILKSMGGMEEAHGTNKSGSSTLRLSIPIDPTAKPVTFSNLDETQPNRTKKGIHSTTARKPPRKRSKPVIKPVIKPGNELPTNTELIEQAPTEQVKKPSTQTDAKKPTNKPASMKNQPNTKPKFIKNSNKKQRLFPVPKKRLLNKNLKSVLKPIFRGSFVDLQKTFPVQPVWIRGKRYKTISVAKRKLREPVTVIVQKCANPKNLQYKFLKQTLNPGLSDKVQNTNKKFLSTLYPYVYGSFPKYTITKRKPRPINIRGTYYPNLSKAKRELKEPRRVLLQKLFDSKYTNYQWTTTRNEPPNLRHKQPPNRRRKQPLNIRRKQLPNLKRKQLPNLRRKQPPNLRLIFLQTWRHSTKVKNQFLKLIWKMLRYKYGCSWKNWLKYGLYDIKKLRSIEKVPFIHSSRTLNLPLKRDWVQLAKYRTLIRTHADIKLLAILSHKNQTIPPKLDKKLDHLSGLLGKKIQSLLLPRTVSMYDLELAKKKQSQKLVKQNKNEMVSPLVPGVFMINQKQNDSKKVVIKEGLTSSNNQIKKRVNSVSKQLNQLKKTTVFTRMLYDIEGQFFISAQAVIDAGLVKNRNQFNARLQSGSKKWLTWRKRRFRLANKKNNDAVQQNDSLLPKTFNHNKKWKSSKQSIFNTLIKPLTPCSMVSSDNFCKGKSERKNQMLKKSFNKTKLNQPKRGYIKKSETKNPKTSTLDKKPWLGEKKVSKKSKIITRFNRKSHKPYKPPKKHQPLLVSKGLRGFSKTALKKHQARKKLLVRRPIKNRLKMVKSRQLLFLQKQKKDQKQKKNAQLRRQNPNLKTKNLLNQKKKTITISNYLRFNSDKKIGKVICQPPRRLAKQLKMNVLLVVEYYSRK